MTVLPSGGGAANENSHDKEGDEDVAKGDYKANEITDKGVYLGLLKLRV